MSYPALIPYEESLERNPYDVKGWTGYLAEIDDILDVLGDRFEELVRREQQRKAASSNKKSKMKASEKVVEVGGRTVRLDAGAVDGAGTSTASKGPIYTLTGEIRSLQNARNQVSERSLSLLPGSYKLWWDYLQFRSEILTGSSGTGRDKPNPNQCLASSLSHRQYRAAVSAYERSLVRCNKYPRIWLSYVTYVIQFDPTCSVTNVRRLFDRCLLALPATQHQKIWDEYICWVTRSMPPWLEGGNVGRDMLGPVCSLYKKGKLSDAAGSGTCSTNDGSANDGADCANIPPETVLRVVRRYVHSFDPSARELLADLCLKYDRWGEGAATLVSILNDSDYLSPRGTTRHEMWLRFAEVATEHPLEVRRAGVDFDAIVRAAVVSNAKSAGEGWEVFDHLPSKEEAGGGVAPSGDDNAADNGKNAGDAAATTRPQSNLANLGELEGTLWTKLANYHINSGEFELARSVYEEAMETVSRVRDFSLIFDEYMKFEEGVVEALMELRAEEDEGEGHDGDRGVADQSAAMGDAPSDKQEDLDILLGAAYARNRAGDGGEDDDDGAPASADIELALARAENLTSRRPILLNRVLLRQNPHNVGEWTKRATLYLQLGQTRQAIKALEEAFTSVNAVRSVNGSPSVLWTSLAGIYEDNEKDFDAARTVYKRVCRNGEYRFSDVDDLAQLWAGWVEFELRHENWDNALSVARQSVSNPEPERRNRITRGLGRSLRLWNLLLDLEESLGTVQTTKDAYNRVMEVKVATPSHVLNYASFLTEHKYFEESFNAYERGVELFPFPHPGAKLIWKAYLDSFLKRYEGTKIPRTRELFDRCIEICPPDQASEFFLSYGSFEEQYGLTKRALSVYEKMCTTLPSEDKFSAYQLYIAKTVKYLGVTATRPLYERAIAALEDEPAAKMCLEFSDMETTLGEVERARTALTYGAQLADPRRYPEYWAKWHDFEVQNGNEETFREMLRVKRSVQAAFSTVNYNAAEMGAGAPKVETLSNDRALEEIAAREGVKINEQPRIGGFVQGKRTAEIKDLEEVERRAAKIARRIEGSGDTPRGGDDIDLSDEDDEGEDVATTAPVQNVQTKAIPAAVYGGLAAKSGS